MMEQSGGGIWRWILEHPALAFLVAFVSFGATFSPKVNGMAAWSCIAISSVFWICLVLGAADKVRSKWPLTLLVALVGLGGLFFYGRWLTTKNNRAHLHVTSLVFSAPTDVGETASVKITFINNGDLPVKKLIGYSHLAFYVVTGNRSDQQSFENSLLVHEPQVKPQDLPDNEIPVGDDRSTVINSDSKWEEQAIARFRAKQAFVYVAGGLVYSDGNSMWTTKYCSYVRSDGQCFFCGKGNEEP